jgi:hypothetical protein
MFGVCFVIVEILLFIAGLWALISGRLPGFVFGKKYRVAGWGARLIGLIIAAPLLIGVGAGVLLGLIYGPAEGGTVASGLEFFSLLAALILALVISRLVRRPVGAGAGAPPASPHFETEPLTTGLLDLARRMAQDQEKRQLVIITPGRLVRTSDPLPPAEALPPDIRAEAEAMAPTDRLRTVIAGSLTNLVAFEENPHQAVPFLGGLEALVQIGHAVILFIGPVTELAEMCRGADLLIMDSALGPFLPADWLATAQAVMAEPNVIQINRSGPDIQGMQRLGQPQA